MKKQGSGKKGLAGILIAVGALVLVTAVALGIVFMGGKQQDTPAAPTDDEIILYWNVERSQYVGKGVEGASGRMPRSDGYYYVRFAVGGEQVDYQVADYNLVQKIDILDVMGLEFDEQGVIVGVKNVNECTGGLVASSLYVVSVEGNTLVCNTQGTFKGIEVKLELNENVQVYDVGQTGLLCGLKSEVVVDDEIIAVKDYDGEIIYVFRKGATEPGDVYWNITRKYNSATKTSTREMDPSGGYVIDMALNGQVVQVRTRDYNIVTKIDAKAAKCTGLEFDENGNVSAVTSASTVAGGTTFASWAHVFEVKGDQVYAKKLSGSKEGVEYFGTLSKTCKIINVSGVGGEIGSYTQLQYGDQIHGLTDNRGRVCYVWVVSRLAGNDGWHLYWNTERKYDSATKTTKRTPAADGYYYFEVATDGQKLTVKTQDKEMANKLDSYAARCFTMLLNENNEIVKIGSATQIHGGSTFGSWYYVDKIDGRNLTVSRILTGDTVPTVMEGVMAEDVEIINGSTNFSSHCGEYATLKVGDRVHCLKDLNGNIRVIFIVEKTVEGPVYWNVGKKAVKNDMTTRQRGEDGYFHFTMAAGGKQYELKTKDAELATKIDSVAAKCMGLTVSKDGIITKVHGVGAVNGCQGGTKSMSWVDVLKISGKTFVAQKDPKSNVATAGQIFTSKMASGCKVYNVSSNFNSFCGEETTLRVGDRVHVLHNRDGDATVVFVVDRPKTLDEKNTCPCNANVKWEPWDGTTALENNKYYYLTADVKAPTEGFILEGISVSLRLDGHTISSDGRCFYMKSGSRLNICDHETRGKLIGSGVLDGEGKPESGGVIRVYSSGATVNLWNIDIARADSDVVAKEGGLISCSGTVSLYDCNLSGGEATIKGGNVQVSSSGTFRMFGGTVKGGTAPSGSSINATGRTYLEDVTVTGGSGSSIVCNSTFDMVMNGVTSDKLYAYKGTVTLLGTLNIDKLTVSADAVLADGGMEPGGKINLTCKPETAQVVMTGASQVGYKALTSFDPEDYALSYDAAKKTVTVTCTIVPKTHTKNHCACAGNASGLGEHTCKELTGWKELTADILVDSPTSGNLAFPESGNYYLSLDLELTKSIDILPDQQITLCLNGCELSGSKRIFRINGTLNITDCSGEGEVVGKAALAAVFYTYAGGELNLFGGTLSTQYSGSACTWGGIGAVASDAGNRAEKGSSTMNMYGGTILGGKVCADAKGANGVGGAIAVLASGGYSNDFNMYGGTITGGSAERLGGNLYAPSGANVRLLGGTITGGSAVKGADVYLVSSKQPVLGGSVKIGRLYLASGLKLQIQELKNDAAVGIEMAVPGVFAEYTGTCTDSNFTSVDSAYQVYHMGDKLKLDLNASLEGHIHCVCGGSAQGMHTHECANQVYEAWESADSLPTASGNYYLTKDVHLTSTEGHKIGANSINLCLNGYKITGEGRLIWVNSSSGNLNICDHPGNNGSLEAPGVADGNAGGLIRHGTGGAHVGLYNINLRRSDAEGSRVLVKEGGIMSCSAFLDMYNVTMENGYAKKAGNLLIALTAKVNMIGCTISGGTSTDDIGGNISIGGTKADDPVTVTMIDTTVTGGSAKGNGDGIRLSQNNSILILGGKINVTGNGTQNLYVETGCDLSLDGLSSESQIGVTMSSADVIAQSQEDLSGCFISDDSGLQVFFDEKAQEIYLADQERSEVTEPERIHQNHCICGGSAEDVGGHSCDPAVQWQPLTQAAFEDTKGTATSKQGIKLISDGYYYLTEDMELSARLCILPGQNIHICLNGYTLSRSGGSAAYVAGNLAIADCGQTGTVTGEYSTTNSISNGGTIKVLAGGKLELYSGTLTSNITGMINGGVIQLSVDKGSLTTSTENSEFNMYGGTITGGKATNGGNVCAWKNTTFNMYAGTISGGTAANGNNLYLVGSDALFNLVGGQIVEGDVQLKTGKVVVGGTARIEEVSLTQGKQLQVSEEIPLAEGASIGVSMEEAGVFATVAKETDSGYFTSLEGGKITALPNGERFDLTLVTKAHKDHCICEGASAKPEGHQCESVTWIALTQEMFDQATDSSAPVKLTSDGYVLDNGGHYYLAESITIKKTLTPGEHNSFNLCLNGMTLEASGARALYFKGTLNLCDCDYTDETVEEETVRTYNGSVISTLKGTTNTHAAVAYPRMGGILNLFGGNLADSTADTAKSGAIIYVGGQMNMYGGKISGGNSSGNGGNVTLVDEGVVRMFAGTVCDGKTAGSGASFYLNSGCQLHISGGTVSGGESAANGGSIFVKKDGQLVISGGEITNGMAGAGKNGGNIRLEGTLEMTGGTISGGTAKEGGNIAISGSGIMRMKGGIVEGGVAEASGGNFAVFGKLSVEGDALIKDGVAQCDGVTSLIGGGNIYGLPNSTDIQITGGRIVNGKSQYNGANIFLRSASGKTAKLNIVGGYIGDPHPQSGANAYSVYLFKNKGTILATVGGNAQVDHMGFSDAKMLALADTALTEGASIGVSLKSGDGTVIQELDTTATILYENIIKAAQTGKKTVVSNGALVIEDE